MNAVDNSNNHKGKHYEEKFTPACAVLGFDSEVWFNTPRLAAVQTT
jgi:hypothetical protein